MTEPGTHTTAELRAGPGRAHPVVHRLESGGAPLAESLALWERGEQLAAICQSFLEGARAKVAAARPEPAGLAEPEPEPER